MKTSEKILSLGVAALAFLTPDSAVAQRRTPDARGCKTTIGQELVSSSSNVTAGKDQTGNIWTQEESGQSSLNLNRHQEVSAAFSFDGEGNNQQAIVEATMANGDVITDTVKRDRDDLTWFQPEGLTDKIGFRTEPGVTASLRVCNTTSEVFIPIASNQ